MLDNLILELECNAGNSNYQSDKHTSNQLRKSVEADPEECHKRQKMSTTPNKESPNGKDTNHSSQVKTSDISASNIPSSSQLTSSAPIQQSEGSSLLSPPGKSVFSPPFSPLDLRATTLKKKTPISSFISLNFKSFQDQHQSLSCRDRMRELGKYHFHIPHPEEECEFLNVPDKRINLHSFKDVMFLCGGLVGVRFESEEIRALHRIANELERFWIALEHLFEAMHQTQQKMSIADATESNDASAMSLHNMAADYLKRMEEMQSIVRVKQASIDRTNRVATDAPQLDPDPESKMGTPTPDWYMILKVKYLEYLESNKLLPERFKFTLGKFAVFLANCSDGSIKCTKQEMEALSKVIDASKDSKALFHSSPHAYFDRKEMAYRFFNFVKSVPEIRSEQKDEDAVKNMKFV